MKLTFQITGSLALGLWAILFFFPGASQGKISLLTMLIWRADGSTLIGQSIVTEAVIISVVLLGYAVFALIMASRQGRK